MKKIILIILACSFIILLQCTDQAPKKSTEKAKTPLPYVSAGHGAIFYDGKEVKPDLKLIINTQKRYIKSINKEVKLSESLKKQVALITKNVKDEVLRNALIIDQSISDGLKNKSLSNKKTNSNQLSRLLIANNILRSYYVRNLQKDPKLPTKNDLWKKGLSDKLAAILEQAGVGVSMATNAGGEQYLAECIEAGVPVPENMFEDEGWENLGVFENEFISENREAELWIYRSEDPSGVCLALPRFAGNEAVLFGIICMNTQNGNTCFFDNNRSESYLRGENHKIEKFIGGTDLLAGLCTDCHAGENPFIVHANGEYTPFDNITTEIIPRKWYTPLVPLSNVQGDWPQNPEPTFNLSSIVGDRNCTSCHNDSYAGRFPLHLDELGGYCGTIFNQAISSFAQGRPTMPPPNNGELCEYAEQVNYILRLCGQPEIEPCPGLNFEEIYLGCDFSRLCDIKDLLKEIPPIPVGCEVIDCCTGCPFDEDFLIVELLFRSEVMKSIQVSSLTPKGKKVNQIIYNDKPQKIALLRSQKGKKVNQILFSPNPKENYKSASKLIQDKKTEVVAKIIINQLADNEMASTQKLMLKIKS